MDGHGTVATQMLSELRLRLVGPVESLAVKFGPRLNVILGDNGLGKTFLLDVAWWALTRTWAGLPAEPPVKTTGKPSISFTFDTTSKQTEKTSVYDREDQHWPRDRGRPPNPGLVVYARVDGGFSVWDPAQNYWKTKAGVDDPDRRDIPTLTIARAASRGMPGSRTTPTRTDPRRCGVRSRVSSPKASSTAAATPRS